MGGGITVESIQGRGSLFSLFFPYDSATEKVNEKSAALHKKQHRVYRFSGNVLVGDEDRNSSLILNTLLTKAGLSVTVSNSFDQLIETLKTQKFDVILFNTELTAKHPAARCEQIAHLAQLSNDAVLLAVTSSVEQSLRENCEQAGCSQVIVKPFGKKILYEILQQYLTPDDPDTSDEQTCLSDEATSPVSRYGDIPELSRVIEEIAERLPILMGELNAAVRKGDEQALLTLSQSLKGAGDQGGFSQLESHAAQLERMAKSKAFDDANDLMKEIEKICHQIVSSIK